MKSKPDPILGALVLGLVVMAGFSWFESRRVVRELERADLVPWGGHQIGKNPLEGETPISPGIYPAGPVKPCPRPGPPPIPNPPPGRKKR